MNVLTFLNGDTMPILGLGTFQAERGVIYDVVKKAIELGYRHIDCAHIYGNEKEIGQALEDCIASGTVSREDLWITSKLWNDCHEPEHIQGAIEQSLADLRLDFLDLYLVHWPLAFKHGTKRPKTAADFLSHDEVPLTATWGGMEAIHAKGLARHIGVSNFNVGHLESILQTASVKPAMNQVELHPYLAQNNLVDYCHKHQVHVTAYSSFGSKARPGDRLDDSVPLLLEHPVVRDIALRRGMTPAQVLLAWSVERGIAVIPKSVNAPRLAQNLQTLQFDMQPDDMKAVEQLDQGVRFVRADFWDVPGSPYSSKTLWGS